MTLVVEGVRGSTAPRRSWPTRRRSSRCCSIWSTTPASTPAAAADKRIHLGVGPHGRLAAIAVRDHGPGVSPAVRRRLFRSFSKSAEEAAATAPGIGLGLALSRRLARDMGGDLRLDQSVAEGAVRAHLPASVIRGGHVY